MDNQGYLFGWKPVKLINMGMQKLFFDEALQLGTVARKTAFPLPTFLVKRSLLWQGDIRQPRRECQQPVYGTCLS